MARRARCLLNLDDFLLSSISCLGASNVFPHSARACAASEEHCDIVTVVPPTARQLHASCYLATYPAWLSHAEWLRGRRDLMDAPPQDARIPPDKTPFGVYKIRGMPCAVVRLKINFRFHSRCEIPIQ
ncbi:hypothetical protein DFH06DRAFT_1384017 [Mycena polygramma]|nr:hypothetical protein DFH06DRAFT_1384017 [Mycena polygramma]